MNLLRPKTTFGWPQTVTIVMTLVLLPVSAVVRSDEPVAPSIEQQPLFEAGKDGYFNYRIPSLVVTSRGTVLALWQNAGNGLYAQHGAGALRSAQEDGPRLG